MNAKPVVVSAKDVQALRERRPELKELEGKRGVVAVTQLVEAVCGGRPTRRQRQEAVSRIKGYTLE